jgi:hypothetical protein
MALMESVSWTEGFILFLDDYHKDLTKVKFGTKKAWHVTTMHVYMQATHGDEDWPCRLDSWQSIQGSAAELKRKDRAGGQPGCKRQNKRGEGEKGEGKDRAKGPEERERENG